MLEFGVGSGVVSLPRVKQFNLGAVDALEMQPKILILQAMRFSTIDPACPPVLSCIV